VSLALSLSVIGVAELLGTIGVLVAFVAGVAFNVTGSSDAKERQEVVQEAITRFFDLPIFVLLGMALPWEGWLELGWVGLLLAVSMLVLRRIPAALLLRPLLGPLRRTKDVPFLGWFGPLGRRRDITLPTRCRRRASRRSGPSAASSSSWPTALPTRPSPSCTGGFPEANRTRKGSGQESRRHERATFL
jgi:hypothetical protein